MGFVMSVEFVKTTLVQRFSSAMGGICRARPVKDKCFFLGLEFLLGLEVVEHLVMATAPLIYNCQNLELLLPWNV